MHDTVNTAKHFHRLDINGYDAVLCPTLDDRLGIYTICSLLPTLIGPYTYDVLITEGEESGASTAAAFTPPDGKQYNWVVEFDRRGTDVVLYQYEGNKDMVAALKAAGYKIGVGTFTDISKLEFLGTTCVNIGVGYNNEHSIMSVMFVSDYLLQITRFVDKFWPQNRDKFYQFQPYMPNWKTYPALGTANYSHTANYGYDDDGYSYYDYSKKGANATTDIVAVTPTRHNGKTWQASHDDSCGLCEVHPRLRKVGDLWLCEDCLCNFSVEVEETLLHEARTQQTASTLTNDGYGEFDECENCGLIVSLADLKWGFYGDYWELLCKSCIATLNPIATREYASLQLP